MNQSDIDRAVAAATGESICTVRRMGFTLRVPQDAEAPTVFQVKGVIESSERQSLQPSIAQRRKRQRRRGPIPHGAEEARPIGCGNRRHRRGRRRHRAPTRSKATRRKRNLPTEKMSKS